MKVPGVPVGVTSAPSGPHMGPGQSLLHYVIVESPGPEHIISCVFMGTMIEDTDVYIGSLPTPYGVPHPVYARRSQ